MLKLRILCLCIIVSFFTACKSHKLKKNVVVIGENTEKEVLVDSISINAKPNTATKVFFETDQTDFEKIKIKSKIEIKSSQFNQTIPANIHIRKDSTIWISIALGLEAARANINPDSIVLLDRIKRRFFRSNFDEISKQFNFTITYDMLQSLMIGNLPVPVNESDVYVKNSDFNSIEQVRNQITINNKFDITLNKLYSIVAFDNQSKTTLNINYKEFTKVDGKFVPRIIAIEVLNNSPNSNNNVLIVIEHSKFDFLDRNIRFPFSIPKGYVEQKIPGF
jgi:hypothetical protein